MTDNEIIKALECFALDKDFDDSQCIGCAFEHKFCTANMSVDIAKPALDLINQQKADFEKSNEIIKDLKKQNGEIISKCRLFAEQGDKLLAEIDRLQKELKKQIDEKHEFKAEIERLKAEADQIAEDYSNLVIEKDELFDEAEKLIKKARAEAVKEFVDLAIKKICEKVNTPSPTESYIVEKCIETIDNLLKETVGDNNA